MSTTNFLIPLSIALVLVISFSCLVTYLIFNWWRPDTRIKTNGRQFLIERVNIFFIWQHYMFSGSLASADYVCSKIMDDWLDKKRKYRFVTDDELSANRIELANRRDG